MEYRSLGRSGLKVSSLCVGTMTWGSLTNEADAIRIVDEALERGVNFFDTSNSYNGGTSEEILGNALSGNGKRDQAVVATKVTTPVGKGPNQGGSSRYHIMEQCEASLRRLRTDRIDLYQIHYMDLSTPVEEVLRALDDLVRQGKVRYIGTSKWVPSYLAEAIMISTHYGWQRFVSEQPPYNLLDRSIEKELVWTCLRHGVGIIPWAPLATGILSGQYESAKGRPAGSRAEAEGVPDSRLTNAAVERAQALAPLAKQRGLTLAQFSLAWLHGQPGVTAPILGVRKLDYLLTALEGIEVRVTDEELAKIDEIAPPGSAVSNYWDSNTFRVLRAAVKAREIAR